MKQDGVYWLRTPTGTLFYSKGINVLHGGEENAKSLAGKAYYWRNHFASLDQWRAFTTNQLTRWGFNTRGGWSDPSPRIPLPLMVELDLGRMAKLHWADPFAPNMPAITLQKAKEITAPYRNNPWLVGYFTDNEVGWWNSPMFRWYLKKGWENHTKRVLWQLLHDTYQGSWDRLLQDWVPQGSLQSFDDLRQPKAELKLKPGGQGIRVVDHFTYLCARRYYRLVHDAIRQAHPGVLILGDRLPLYYHQDAVRAIGDSVDVISTNYNVDSADGWVAPYYFESLQRLTGKPVLVTEFFFAADENRSGNLNPGHLMNVATQTERARGVGRALRNFARFPNVIGAHWFQYWDEPTGGREDGEDYNMGLVDIANRPYEQVTDVFRALNPQLEILHSQSGTESAEAEPQHIIALPRAREPIDISDKSLRDWDKATTRLQHFQISEPYAPFADVHLAWRPEGLYFASFANSYLDGEFLAYEGSFPLSETFQMHVLIGNETKSMHHYAIHLLPKRSSRFFDELKGRLEITPHLYRYAGGHPADRIPTRGHVQQLDKPLPHIAFEGFLPADWLGMMRLEPGQKIRLNVILTNFYREWTMALSSPEAMSRMISPGNLKTFVLQ